MNELVGVDLFAGAGGFSLGAESAGVRIQHAIECDAWAAETLDVNHPGTKVHQEDIRALSDSWIARELPGNPDILIGGPPCQGFSHAGPSRKDPKDPRNSLFREFVRIASVLDPAAVVLENVPGLLRAKTSKGEPVSQIILSELEALGFKMSILELRAEDFGVPQIRRRVFFVGTQAGYVSPPTCTHAELGTLLGDKSPFLTVRDAISDLPVVDVGSHDEIVAYKGHPVNAFQETMRLGAPTALSNHIPMRHTKRMVARFAAIQPGQSQSDVIETHAPRRRTRSVHKPAATYDQNNRRQFWDRPCHTLAASFYANFIHPELNRNFTPREGARIQTFPDRYVFKGKPTVVSQKLLAREGRDSERHLCQYNQIGNAVPPTLGRVVIQSVMSAICGRREVESMAA